MKKLFILPAMFFCGFFAHAQRGSFGLKAGASFYTVKSEDYKDMSSLKPGFHGGAFYRVPVGTLLYFQPEVLYSGEGVKLKDDDATATFYLNYLNVPLMLQISTPGGFFVETGPQLGFLLSAKGKYNAMGQSYEDKIDDEMKKVAFSWGAGLGYMFGNVGVGGRYNFGLSRLPKDDDEGPDKSSGLQVSLIWRLNK